MFPLPNGYAAVFLVPAARADGSFELLSPPGEFGAPGFYFVVRDEAAAWSRTVAAMTEHIHVNCGGLIVDLTAGADLRYGLGACPRR